MITRLAHSRHRSRAAFTLIELLVVISIIALLIGLLLPVLTSTRAAGKSAVCKSNLRQLGVAFYSYADTFDGLIPPSLVTTSDTFSPLAANTRWHTHFMIEWVQQQNFTAAEQAAGDMVEQGDNDIFICPASGDSETPNTRVTQNSYGMNAILNYEHNTLSPPVVTTVNQWPRWRATFKRLEDVTSPSDAMLLIDNRNPSVTWRDYDYDPLLTGAERHDGVNNILFTDGHVEGTRLDEVPQEINGQVAPDPAIDSFWFGL